MPAQTPHSLRLASQGARLSSYCNRTGIKAPDVARLALQALFEKYPNDADLARAVFEFRANQSKSEPTAKRSRRAA